mmetsp:Transcript_51723/g.138015  ORF Transcript_51723/g.138015 Transcript_51723/m.138015 type:complete len:97 (+) Transcript_51723:1801-2091(+)
MPTSTPRRRGLLWHEAHFLQPSRQRRTGLSRRVEVDLRAHLSSQVTDRCHQAREGKHLAWELGYTMCQSMHKQVYDFSKSVMVENNTVNVEEDHHL